MIGFFIKKAFFDGWDNLVGLFLQNLIYILMLMCALGALVISTDASIALTLVLLIAVLLVTSILLGGTAGVVKNYSDYERDTWSAFALSLKNNIRHSLLFFAICLFILLMGLYVIPFYLSIGNTLTAVLVVVLMWVLIILLLALPYYFPLMNLLPGDKPLKTLKKCFIIVSDNLLFTLFYFIYNAVIVGFSVLFFGLVPGVAGYMLGAQDAMKLLMLKYDYLEEHPDADRKSIPWADLLYEEKEKVGPRSLRSMIFPWK